jgi:hypothetical protein
MLQPWRFLGRGIAPPHTSYSGPACEA